MDWPRTKVWFINFQDYQFGNLANLGCTYRNNAKAWMTQIIFLEWLKAFDLRMANRKVLLILDNCSAHTPLHELPHRIQLKNTTVFYLPPNTTSKLQPCDAGIIRNLKAYYRRAFNRRLLQNLEDGIAEPEKFDVLDAIRMVIPAWKEDVKPETIRNCFGHCKIRTGPGSVDEQHNEEDFLDQQVVAELESQITRLRYRNPMDIRNLVNYPDEDIVSYTPDIDEVMEDHLLQNDEEAQANEDDSGEVRPISAKEAQTMIQSLEMFWLQQAEDSGKYVSALQQMKASLRTRQIVQSSIQDYFHHI